MEYCILSAPPQELTLPPSFTGENRVTCPECSQLFALALSFPLPFLFPIFLKKESPASFPKLIGSLDPIPLFHWPPSLGIFLLLHLHFQSLPLLCLSPTITTLLERLVQTGASHMLGA